ncbi:hypothetical protein Syun_009856 [Stephania yunnanensis]|uniref:Uncharacterized protein n=1 Tax=Stephania yunnanensis TaxID=152371 RepID=A0AAP0KHS7_9MAGN
MIFKSMNQLILIQQIVGQHSRRCQGLLRHGAGRQARSKPCNGSSPNRGSTKRSRRRSALEVLLGLLSRPKRHPQSPTNLQSIPMIGIRPQHCLHILQRQFILSHSLKRPSSAEQRPPEARLHEQRLGALGHHGVVIDWLHLHQTGGAVAVEDSAVRVGLGSEAEGLVVLLQSPHVVLGLEPLVSFFFELVSSFEEDRGVQIDDAVTRRSGGGGGRAVAISRD